MAVSDLASTLRAAATAGAAGLPAEQRAALETSLPLTCREAGLASLELVGKVLTSSGKDYLLAKGTVGGGYMLEGKAVVQTKLYYSLDAVKWMELDAATPSAKDRTPKIAAPFSGDVTKVFTVKELKPPAEEAEEAAQGGEAAEGEEGAEEAAPAEAEAAEPEFDTYEVSELDRLCATAEALVGAVGDVAPAGAMVLNATENFAMNKLFSGVTYPDKLESYVHLAGGPDGASLAKDTRGSWALQYDGFSQTAVLRSLLWPGFVFFLDNSSGRYGSLYVGSGIINTDLPFML